MKCGSCSVEIKPEFTYARKVNVCPSCGNQIMPPERVELFNKLKELVSAAYSDLDLTGPVCLDFTEFEVRIMPVKTKQTKTDSDVEVSEDEVETRSISSGKSGSSAPRSLHDLRKEAYEDALREQFGMLDDNGNANPVQLLIEDKQEQARENMLSGSGAVRRK
jgi:DNA-directed RNA polymerase subunit RPC12/RpoP